MVPKNVDGIHMPSFQKRHWRYGWWWSRSSWCQQKWQHVLFRLEYLISPSAPNRLLHLVSWEAFCPFLRWFPCCLLSASPCTTHNRRSNCNQVRPVNANKPCSYIDALLRNTKSPCVRAKEFWECVTVNSQGDLFLVWRRIITSHSEALNSRFPKGR